MRYRETELPPGSTDYVAPTTDEFVALTVWLTLIIGLVLLAGGIYGKQRWLKFLAGPRSSPAPSTTPTSLSAKASAPA